MKKTAQQREADIDAKMQRYLRRLDRLRAQQVDIEARINDLDERICALSALRFKEADDETY